VTADQLRTYEDSSQAWQDEIWTAAAENIIEKHKPNLLLFHLLTLDDINHAYGPMTPASFTAMALLDANVRRIIDALDRSGLTNNATLIIVSDHGFRGYKNKIRPNVLLRDKGLINGTGDQSKGDVWVMPEGGTAMVYITKPDRKSELLPQLHQSFAAIEGVDQIYGTEDFANLGLPLPTASDQAPDLFLTAKPDYMFSGESEGELVSRVPDAGTHGYINSDPNMQAIFIASGVGIPKGVRIDSISNLDVAPTIAVLLGLEMKNVKGHAIQPIVDFVAQQKSQFVERAK
jgi:predicted AlkP superfamily pyrophosphatase or phosphodiesterase